MLFSATEYYLLANQCGFQDYPPVINYWIYLSDWVFAPQNVWYKYHNRHYSIAAVPTVSEVEGKVVTDITLRFTVPKCLSRAFIWEGLSDDVKFSLFQESRRRSRRLPRRVKTSETKRGRGRDKEIEEKKLRRLRNLFLTITATNKLQWVLLRLDYKRKENGAEWGGKEEREIYFWLIGIIVRIGYVWMDVILLSRSFEALPWIRKKNKKS